MLAKTLLSTSVAEPCSCAGQISMAAAAYGLLVHWRLYPIIHALPLLLVLRSDKPACLGLPISTRQVSCRGPRQACKLLLYSNDK